MSYAAEVVVYPTGRSQEELAYRAYVKIGPKDGDAQIISGEFGPTREQAIASALSSLKLLTVAATELLKERVPCK
jgi:hypothetical protein